jgi:hypothetical protein
VSISLGGSARLFITERSITLTPGDGGGSVDGRAAARVANVKQIAESERDIILKEVQTLDRCEIKSLGS